MRIFDVRLPSFCRLTGLDSASNAGIIPSTIDLERARRDDIYYIQSAPRDQPPSLRLFATHQPRHHTPIATILRIRAVLVSSFEPLGIRRLAWSPVGAQVSGFLGARRTAHAVSHAASIGANSTAFPLLSAHPEQRTWHPALLLRSASRKSRSRLRQILPNPIHRTAWTLPNVVARQAGRLSTMLWTTMDTTRLAMRTTAHPPTQTARHARGAGVAKA